MIGGLSPKRKPVPKLPKAFLPESYAMTMVQSFSASCGIAALVIALEDREPEEGIKIKETLIKAWKDSWVNQFKEDIEEYNQILADSLTTKTEDLPQPEEYQLGFTRALKMAENTARKSLGLEPLSS